MGFFDKIKKTISDIAENAMGEKELNSLLGGIEDKMGLGKISDRLKKLANEKPGSLLGSLESLESLVGNTDKKPTERKKSAASTESVHEQQKPRAIEHKPSSTNDLLSNIESHFKLETSPVKPAVAESPRAEDATMIVMDTNLAMILLKSFFPKAEADSDGDIKIAFEAKEDATIKNLMYVYVYPGKLTFDRIVAFVGGMPSCESTMQLLAKHYSDVDIKKEENKVRLKLSLSVEGLSTNDTKSIIEECQGIINRLGEAAYNLMIGTIAEEEQARPKGYRFFTRQIEKWLDVQDNVSYTTDSDGDVLAQYKYADDERINWYVWYYVTPECLTIDAGYKEYFEWVDPSEMARQFNSQSGLKGITAQVNSKGNLRLKAEIAGGDGVSYDSVVEKWVDIHFKFGVFFKNLAKTNRSYQDEMSRRAAASIRSQSSVSSSSSSRSSSNTSSRSSSSTRSSGPSSAQLAKQEERERKAAEKRKKDDAIRVVDDAIARQQSLIEGYRRNIKDWSKTPQQARNSRQAINDSKQAIMYAQNKIADLKKKKQRIKNS